MPGAGTVGVMHVQIDAVFASLDPRGLAPTGDQDRMLYRRVEYEILRGAHCLLAGNGAAADAPPVITPLAHQLVALAIARPSPGFSVGMLFEVGIEHVIDVPRAGQRRRQNRDRQQGGEKCELCLEKELRLLLASPNPVPLRRSKRLVG